MITGTNIPRLPSWLTLPAVLLLLAGAAWAQSPAAPGRVPEELLRSLASRQSANVAYRETKQVSELTRPLELQGTLHYRAPDTLKKVVLKPRRESYTVEGDLLTIVQGGEEKGQYSLDEHPRLRAFVESIRATLAGDLERLQRYYKISFQGTVEQWKLSLVPREEALADIIAKIEIRGRGADLEQFLIEETGGDRSLMRISTIGE